MEDLHEFHSRNYEKSADLESVPILQRIIDLLKVLPRGIMKVLIVVVAELYYSLLEPIYHYFVPVELADIRGQLAAVTGGSNGIGREICLELARCGCDVACLDVDLDAARKLCAELRELGVKASAYEVDVTDYARIEEVKKEINKDMGTVDILINNAGIIPKHSLLDGSPSDIQRLMDINVMANFWTTRIFIGDMISRHRGYIVGVCSMIAFFPVSLLISYASSKFAVKGFMDALARESRHEQWGVKTLTVFPYWVNTRKQTIDYLRSKVESSNLERIPILTPFKVAHETVQALRRGAGYVSIPRHFLALGKLHQSLSFETQNLIDDLFMPRLTSQTKISEENKKTY